MKIHLIGDVMLGRLVNENLKHRDARSPWGDALPLLQSADWLVCNLECVLADDGVPWSASPKEFHFRSDSKNVAVLSEAGVDAVSLANNHTLDFEYDALAEMLGLLDSSGIAHAGAGLNWREAVQPAIGEIDGTKVGLISFTDNEPVWKASEHRPGVFYAPVDPAHPDAQVVLGDVGRVKEHVDLLIVAAHWGSNWGYTPPRNHIAMAHALVDAGADVVFGHSAHVFRGVEIYHNRPILYSAGNFIDDYVVDAVERNDRSFIFVLDVDDGKLRHLDLAPTIIEDYHAGIARGDEARDTSNKMTHLSNAFNTHLEWNPPDALADFCGDTLSLHYDFPPGSRILPITAGIRAKAG